jgi:hypothetical protein
MLEQVGIDLRAGVAGAHDEYALPASSSEDRSRLREYGRLSQVAAPPRTLGDIVAVGSVCRARMHGALDAVLTSRCRSRGRRRIIWPSPGGAGHHGALLASAFRLAFAVSGASAVIDQTK